MYTEARKLQLIEELLKVTNEDTLIQLESVINSWKKKQETIPSIYDFVGIMTKEESTEMKKAIEESCETINSDDWK